MFSSAHSPSDAYALVGVETGVMAANPHKLVLMLFDGALLAIAMARQAMATNKIAEKGEEISRAINIISNGLKVSLDTQAGTPRRALRLHVQPLAAGQSAQRGGGAQRG